MIDSSATLARQARGSGRTGTDLDNFLRSPTGRATLAVLLLTLLVGGLLVILDDAGEDPPPARIQLTRVVADFSDSAMTENGSDLNASAFNAVTDLIDSMNVGTAIEVTGFTNRPGQSCDPINLPFPAQANPESQEQLRRDLKNALPTLWAEYTACLTDPETGHVGAGSGIFGAVVIAATKPVPPDQDLIGVLVITDGCSYGELKENTCTAKVLDDPAGPQRVVANMPGALKPPLQVSITLSGLGRGTRLEAAPLLTLKRVYTLWGTATGAHVTFAN